MAKEIILASASPRRRELLSHIGLKFRVETDPTDEVVVGNPAPSEMVQMLAEKKGRNVAATQKDDAIIISADTVVALEDEVLGKPKDEADAFLMLSKLSGNKHYVYTGYFILDTETKKFVKGYERTEVTFRKLSDAEIQAYIDTKEPMDKAGAYGIQDFGVLLVEGIKGDYFNVVGLPVCKIYMELKNKFGIELLPN